MLEFNFLGKIMNAKSLSCYSFDLFYLVWTSTIVLNVYSRFTMYEWDNPHPCNDETDEYEFDCNVHNCFWHNWGSLMQQGSDICPRYNCTAASVNANFIVPIKYILKWDILSFFYTFYL